MTTLKTRWMRQTLMSAGALGVSAGLALADQVFVDDVIIQQSLCVGQDCVNGESFGFDTIRLKENNLRIRAQDTSNTASFPSVDWQITFNDSTNGGANKFSIEDLDGGRTPFTIEASAPSNSLYVDDGGRIGLRNNAPVVELHVTSGDSPTLRLEQDGSSGFTPQTWDVAGNETNFFVRDATNGSNLPFRIRTGAPGNAIYVENNGNVGLSTTSPSAPLHVRRAAASDADMFRVESNGASVIRLMDSANGTEWTFQNQNGEFRVASPVVPGPEFVVDDNGNVTITGTLTTGGPDCSMGCDRVFEEDYPLRSVAEHGALMWENGHLPAVGPTSGDQPMNVGEKLGGMLNELEHAHIYIQQLHDRLDAQESLLGRQSDLITAYEMRFEAHDTRLKELETR